MRIKDQRSRLALPCSFPGTFRHVPVMFVEDDAVLGTDMLCIDGVSWYEFGILSSSVHFEWMRTAMGGEEDWKYNPSRVYNTFVWPGSEFDKEMTENRLAPIRAEIESAARRIVCEREAISGFTFAEHYPNDAMPEALRDAHQTLDFAVAKAYGLRPDAPVSEVLSKVFSLYAIAKESLKWVPGYNRGRTRRQWR